MWPFAPTMDRTDTFTPARALVPVSRTPFVRCPSRELNASKNGAWASRISTMKKGNEGLVSNEEKRATYKPLRHKETIRSQSFFELGTMVAAAPQPPTLRPHCRKESPTSTNRCWARFLCLISAKSSLVLHLSSIKTQKGAGWWEES